MGQMQPISYSEMAQYARDVLQIPDRLWTVFFRVIEETDNAVMQEMCKRREDTTQQ